MADPYAANVVLAFSGSEQSGSRIPNEGMVGGYGAIAGTTGVYSNISKYYGKSFVPAGYESNAGGIIFPSNAAYAAGTGAFCIEAWVYQASRSSQWGTFIFNWAGGDAGTYVVITPSGYLSTIGGTATTNQIPLNTWTHVALSRDAGGTYRGFVNGVQVLTSTPAIVNYGVFSPYIGRAYNNATSTTFVGHIQDLRYTVGEARYTAGFTPPDQIKVYTAGDPHYLSTKLLLRGDGVNAQTWFNDSGPTAKAVTPVGGAVTSTTQIKFGDTSIYLNGTNSYLSVADSDDWDFGTGDFTIEAWVYIVSLSANRTLIAQWGGGASTNNAFIFQVTSAGRLYFAHQGSQTLAVTGTTLTVPTGVWTHLALSKSGTAAKMFVDGVADATEGYVPTYVNNSVSPLLVGLTNTTDGGYWNGYIDDLRVTKGVARYPANFTPPTAHKSDQVYVSGTVYSDTGAPCARTVRLYDRTTGELIGSTTSDATTGAYSIPCTSLNEVNRVAIDDGSSFFFNDIIDRIQPV